MSFASNISGMLFLASSAAVASAISVMGCIATDTIEFTEAQNFPPSVVSQSTAAYPLREIGQLNLDDPVDTPELPLDVVVRDPNVDETLEYRIFLDSPTPPGNDFPFDQGEVLPQGGLVERPTTFMVPYTALAPGECHKIELFVVGSFASNVEPRRPVQEGDVDNVTWWVEVIDTDNPVIEVECQ